MKLIKLEKSNRLPFNGQPDNQWIVRGKITAEIYFKGDRINCCCFIGSWNGEQANKKEEDVLSDKTTCEYEEMIEDWPYCNHKETRYYDCKNCEFGGGK